MLQIPTWSRVVTGIILFLGILFALPNALPGAWVAKFPSFLPRSTVTLGLDLQGGSNLLLGVDMPGVYKDKLEQLRTDARVSLRKQHILFRNLQVVNGVLTVQIADAARYPDALGIMKGLNGAASGAVLAVGALQYDLSETGDHTIAMKMSEAYAGQLRTEVVKQSIEVVRRRIDQMGLREPTIEKQGDDRISVQVPGLDKPAELINLLGQTGKMTFQLVDEAANIQQAQQGIVPIDSELLMLDPQQKGGQKTPIVIYRQVMVSGDRLTDAHQDYDQQSGQPDVSFKFDGTGARQFGQVTKENVGHRFAIVLDNRVISAPTIINPILGGSGIITGNFTAQSANELSVLLRAGALPAKLVPLSQSTVGPELGKDQINYGKYSALAGLAMVALFMILRYGLFGLFADIALTFNIVLLMAVLTLFGATLTLPGIAGIVLTMGMAVDANVLIYERIREELRNGRSMLASIDTGFRRALATIVDANATHLIASLILFQLGSGPVRGFAVTLGVGILTSLFTAVMVTRLIVVVWLAVARPRKLAI
ncbi:MAG TPA: protein translocase subunit SecD [Rhizomicrobium sp.]|jgi:protein-export membrane protein SecD